MSHTITLKTYALFFLLFFLNFFLQAQVGIGTLSPEGGSILDITATDKGILIPRVDIDDLNTIAPITEGSPVSLLVYNTNTTTGEGFHFWDGNDWILLLDANSFTSDDINLATDDLIQDTETRTYDLNTQILNFTNGAIGINSPNPTGDFQVISTENHEAFNFTQTNGTTGQRDVFTIEDQDTAGGGQDESSVLKVIKSGAISSEANGYSLIELTSTGADPGDNKYWISGHAVDEGAPLWGVDLTDSDYWSEGGLTLGVSSATDGTYSGGTFRIDPDGDTGIGTITPDISAQLDLSATTKGLLINRVALTATNSETPITSPATGLLVYNMATAGSGTTNVLPGFYYWDGTMWIALAGTNGRDWSLEGNDGTDPLTDFVGTKEDTDLVIRTNNIERARILGSTGNLGVGTVPFTNVGLTVDSFDFGISTTANSTGAGLLATQNSTGQAIVAQNTGGGIAGFFNSNSSALLTSTTASNIGTTIIPSILGLASATDGATGIFAATSGLATTEANIGLRVVAGSNTSITPAGALNIGIAVNAPDLGLSVITEDAINSVGDLDAAIFQTNFSGVPTDANNRDPRVRLAGFEANANTSGGGTDDTFYGAFLYSGGSNANSSFAYAGARVGNTNYKIVGNGTVSTIVSDANGVANQRIMFAPEAPEVLFEDYGTGQLKNGEVQIQIDPIFSQNIHVDREHPLKVFIQLEGDCNGVYVADKSKNGFTVKELQKGTSNVNFSWHIVANRKDEISNTGERSEYSDLRFPRAPQPKLSKESNALNIEDPKDIENKVLRLRSSTIQN